MDSYKQYLDVDIRNNKSLEIVSNEFTFLQVNKIIDCLREKGDLRSYSKNDKSLPILHLTDGIKEINVLVLDSDHDIMNLDPGSKILINLKNLKIIKGIYICFKSQLTLLGGVVENLKQANDIAKETYALRNIAIYNKKNDEEYPKFIPFRPKTGPKKAENSAEKAQNTLSKLSLKANKPKNR